MKTSSSKKRLVVILPTYNEKKNIQRLIPLLFRDIFPRLSNYESYLLVVDDNSPDKTAVEVEKMQKKYSNLYLLKGKKEGLGRAYYRGMKYAVNTLRADVLVEMDADFSHDPQLLPRLVAKLEEGYDFVLANRYIKGGSIPKDWSWKRKFLSFLGNLVTTLILFNWQIRDWTSGYRLFKAKIFKSLADEMNDAKFNGYTWQIAFLNKTIQKGYKIGHVPLVFVDRQVGESKLGSEYIVNTLFYLIGDVLVNPPRFYRFALVGFIGFLINFFGLAFFAHLFKHLWPGLALGLRNFLANALAAELSIISNFFFNNLWTFADRKLVNWREIGVQFSKFNLTSFTTGILVPSLVIGLGTSFLGDQYRQLILVLSIIFFTVPANYFIYNRFIWKTKKTSSQKG